MVQVALLSSDIRPLGNMKVPDRYEISFDVDFFTTHFRGVVVTTLSDHEWQAILELPMDQLNATIQSLIKKVSPRVIELLPDRELLAA